MPVVFKSRNLKLQENSGSLQACTEIVLPLPLPLPSFRISNNQIENQSLNIRSTKHSTCNATSRRVSVSVSGSDTIDVLSHEISNVKSMSNSEVTAIFHTVRSNEFSLHFAAMSVGRPAACVYQLVRSECIGHILQL